MPVGTGSSLKEYCPQFIETFSTTSNRGEESGRTWYLSPQPNNGSSFHGLIYYGSTGYESDIIDKETRKLQYQRKVSDIDIIPLYYCIWVPDYGDYGLLALQTFGLRSCVGRFQTAFESGFRSIFDGYRLAMKPVIPAELASYKNAEVKTFSLLKHDYSSDAAENQLGNPGELVDLNVSFNAQRRATLGTLQTFTNRLKLTGERDALQYNNVEFDEAVAWVSIGGKRRKVTIVGASRNAGKFDLTENVARGANGHPKLESISSEVQSLFGGIVSGGEN